MKAYSTRALLYLLPVLILLVIGVRCVVPEAEGTGVRRVRFVVSGRVQGVGFRWFVRAEARPLGLTGWVRNRTDGAVEGEVEGRDDAIEALIPCLEVGPPCCHCHKCGHLGDFG